MIDEYILENTKVKFYDDYIVENAANQKEYINNIIINLIEKINSSIKHNLIILKERSSYNVIYSLYE